MQPYISPHAEEAEFMPSRRATVSRQSRANHGTLNLFSPSYYEQPDPAPAPLRPGAQGVSRFDRTQPGHRYHNYESTETREFPSSGIRRVKPATHTESAQGIRHLGSVPAAKQNIQVVNITATYKDPTKMEAPRPTVRVLPEKRSSTEVRDSLAYKSANYQTQLRGEMATVPVGRAKSTAPKRVIDYTQQENFCQAVRDHVQQRAKGVTEFYVQLCRGNIGGVAATAAPAPQGRLWSLEHEPEARTLSLSCCRDQLVCLTGMSVTLLELADLLWDMSAYKENVAAHPQDTSAQHMQEEEDLGSLVIPYKDFSAAFSANSGNVRLAVKKI